MAEEHSWLWYLLGNKGHRPQKKNNSAREGNKPTDYVTKAQWHSLEAKVAKQETDDADHKATESQFWRKQLRVGRWLNGITLLAAIVAGAGICVLWKQTYLLQGQLDSMTIEQRPWVSFTDPKVTSDLTFPDLKSNGGQIGFSAIIQNTGKLPAENVHPYVEVYVIGEAAPRHVNEISTQNGLINGVRDVICNERRQKSLTEGFGNNKLYGDVLFPGDKIPHEETSLSEGELEGEIVECPLHGARFNVRTGEVKALPAVVRLQTYPLRVVDDAIEVEI